MFLVVQMGRVKIISIEGAQEPIASFYFSLFVLVGRGQQNYGKLPIFILLKDYLILFMTESVSLR